MRLHVLELLTVACGIKAGSVHDTFLLAGFGSGVYRQEGSENRHPDHSGKCFHVTFFWLLGF